MIKNKRLEKRKQTQERHSKMVCKVFQCKLTKLDKKKEEYLHRLFLEAKYFYNDIIAADDIYKYDYRNTLCVTKNFVSKTYECRHLFILSSQMRQGILDRLKSNVKMLSTKKKKGREDEVGKLKFKSEVNSIPLQQLDATYKLLNNNISLQGCKYIFKIKGLKQIPKNAEICNATLVKKPSGYYIYITTYVEKDYTYKRVKRGNIGIDLGLRTTATDSFGNEYSWLFEETDVLKKRQAKLANQKYSSKNWFKTLKLIKKEYEKIKNRKEDVANKFINILKKYELVAYQNDNIAGWAKSNMKGWGRKIQHSIIGRIKSKIKKLVTSVEVDRWTATTKICPCCNIKNDIKLQNEENLYYECSCGYKEKRDVHSAINILNIALKATGMDYACGLDPRSQSL